MERVIVKDLKRDMRTHKEKLMQAHRVKRRLDTIQEAARKLVRPLRGSPPADQRSGTPCCPVQPALRAATCRPVKAWQHRANQPVSEPS